MFVIRPTELYCLCDPAHPVEKLSWIIQEEESGPLFPRNLVFGI